MVSKAAIVTVGRNKPEDQQEYLYQRVTSGDASNDKYIGIFIPQSLHMMTGSVVYDRASSTTINLFLGKTKISRKISNKFLIETGDPGEPRVF